MRRKIYWDEWTEGQTEGRTEVKQYTPPLRWSGGIIKTYIQSNLYLEVTFEKKVTFKDRWPLN